MREFENKVVVVTGGAKGIGKAIAGEFRKAGAQVCIIDLLETDGFVGDIANQATLEQFAQTVIAEHGWLRGNGSHGNRRHFASRRYRHENSLHHRRP